MSDHLAFCAKWRPSRPSDGFYGMPVLDESLPCTCAERAVVPVKGSGVIAGQHLDSCAKWRHHFGTLILDLTVPCSCAPQRKIILKGSAKQYKTGPRASGRVKLAHQLFRLHKAVLRFAGRAPEDDVAWATGLAGQLGDLVRRFPAVDYGSREGS